jgi:hypothetical protein
MEYLIEIAFTGFWHFVGIVTILSMMIVLITNVWANLMKMIIGVFYNDSNNKVKDLEIEIERLKEFTGLDQFK